MGSGSPYLHVRVGEQGLRSFYALVYPYPRPTDRLNGGPFVQEDSFLSHVGFRVLKQMSSARVIATTSTWKTVE